MTTNTPGTTARQMSEQQIGYLRFKVNFNDAASGVAVNKQWLPKGAIVLRATVQVKTAFNAATTGTLDIGFLGGATILSAVQDVKTAAGRFAQTLATSAATINPLAADTRVTATYASTGAAATAGEAYVVIEYVYDNDLNVGQ
ncbi:hypothetical protein [Bradyrhizobium pachyrhizi]|uniref:hypothetical protein n=1 Tax=Bradyrhizobium pachyrhizi TaxID=280333 RepID=UPI003D363267